MAGLIFTLDLATRTGWAKGLPGSRPVSGSVALKPDDETTNHGRMGNRLCRFLCKQWDRDKPWLVFVEAPMHLGGFHMNANSEANVKLQIGLHMAARMAADIYGLRLIEANVATVRKHFIDHGRLKRDEAKTAVVKRCRLLGYMGPEDSDDNQADALAIWDWACGKYARKIPADLHFFGEGQVQ